MHDHFCYFCFSHNKIELSNQFMKQFLVLLFSFFLVLNSYSQSEFNSKFKPIPPANVKPKQKNEAAPLEAKLPKIVAPNILKETNIFGTKPKADQSFEIGKTTSTFSMIIKDQFVKPGDLIRDKLNRKVDNEDVVVFRRNQDLGSFKTKSLIARVSYRDYGEVDGDQISVFLNGAQIASNIYLESFFKGFQITLVNGFNKIDFEALNQGRLGPNTAEFKVFDDKGTLISDSQWSLATGFKATIIITKE
jgi:hypothetical protein